MPQNLTQIFEFSFLQAVKLSDNQNVHIESVVLFDRICELLLKKPGNQFNTDNDVFEAWEELTASNRFDITLKRKKVSIHWAKAIVGIDIKRPYFVMKKNKDLRYPPAIIVDVVSNIVIDPSFVRRAESDESDTESDYSFDTSEINNENSSTDHNIQNCSTSFGKKRKKNRSVEFPPSFDIKLQEISEDVVKV